MTLGEIYSVMWAVRDESEAEEGGASEDTLELMYQELKEAQARNKAAKNE